MTDLDMFLKVMKGVEYIKLSCEEEKIRGHFYTKIVLKNSTNRITIYFDDEGKRV